ncbi:M48 family metallopeptidase [uncultured Victivallis sp.]|uniref:M48 family metallopeptidase n=1 Tax=uncultured Victivallis sp. TaxID=354118 RepID=UPI0025ECE51F|nr:M48 family metallopeptidase [uncultured Victivallis sp.]
MRNLTTGLIRFCASLVSAAGLILLAAGCVSAPRTGRTQLMFYDESTDISSGAEAWQQVKAQEKVSTNATYNAALQRVGRNIAAAANKPSYDWEFVVFESNEANAFALPGGKVAVYSSLFQLFDNDAELATVAGHEVAHALARHGMERSSQSVIQACGGVMVELALGQDWTPAYQTTSNLLAMLPYSRTQELEADYLGLILMAQAGYDPQAALTFWEKFSKLNQVGVVGEFLSTHPDGEKRLERLRESLAEAQAEYRKSKQLGTGQSYR